MQTVLLKDEHGAEQAYAIDYTTDVTCGQDLVDNTTPARIETILRAEKPTQPHELGLLDRLAHAIATGNCVRLALSGDAELTDKTEAACGAAEKYFVNLLNAIDVEAN